MTEKRVALVTGGSAGSARRSCAGWPRMDCTSSPWLETWKTCGRSAPRRATAGGSAEALACDIADAKALATAVEGVVEKLGRLDVAGEQRRHHAAMACCCAWTMRILIR